MNRILQIIYITLGFSFMAIGIIGIVLPLVPTTPFLLLALLCFVRGSKRFEIWFKETKIYKKHLEEFVNNRSLTLKQKILTNLFADAMIAIPFFILDNGIIKFVLIILVLIKYYYFIFEIKTI